MSNMQHRPIAIPFSTRWYINRLDNRSDKVRENAIVKLRKTRTPAAIESLLQRLGDECAHLRYRAEKASVALGVPERQMVEGYVCVMESGSADVRTAAAAALGNLRDKQALQPLLERLAIGDKDEHFRAAVARALENVGATREQMVTGYVKALASGFTYAKQEAAEALANLGDKRAVRPLIERLADQDSDFRAQVARALAQLGDRRAVEPLIAELRGYEHDRQQRIRGTAAEALGQLGDTRAVEALIDSLEDLDQYVRRLAAEALGKLGDKRSIEPLVMKLGHGCSGDIAISLALAELGDKRAIGPLMERLKYGSHAEQVPASIALGKLGATQAVVPLIERLGNRSNDEQVATVQALGNLKDKRAVGPLIAELENESMIVSEEAAQALAKLGDKRAVEPLIDNLMNENQCLREAVVQALQKLGASREQMIAAYIKALDSSSTFARQGAAEALGDLGDTRALRPLEALLCRTWKTRDAVEDEAGPKLYTEHNMEYSAIEEAIDKIRGRDKGR